LNIKAIGDNIGNQIARNHMTQRECAEKLHITEASMCRYIAGQRTPKATLLYRMSRLFGCTMEDLCYGIDSEVGNE